MAANSSHYKQHFYTPEEYQALEKGSDRRYEFRDGEIVCMSGGSLSHYRIERNIFGLFNDELKGRKCESFTADTPVKSPVDMYYRYPDASVVCGEVQTVHVWGIDCIINPLIIVEVLSDNPDYDKSEKRKIYQAIPSLREYLIIAQDTAHIIHYIKTGDIWRRSEIADLSSSITLPSIDVTLSFADIYDKVTFD